MISINPLVKEWLARRGLNVDPATWYKFLTVINIILILITVNQTFLVIQGRAKLISNLKDYAATRPDIELRGTKLVLVDPNPPH